MYPVWISSIPYVLRLQREQEHGYVPCSCFLLFLFLLSFYPSFPCRWRQSEEDSAATCRYLDIAGLDEGKRERGRLKGESIRQLPRRRLRLAPKLYTINRPLYPFLLFIFLSFSGTDHLSVVDFVTTSYDVCLICFSGHLSFSLSRPPGIATQEQGRYHLHTNTLRVPYPACSCVLGKHAVMPETCKHPRVVWVQTEHMYVCNACFSCVRGRKHRVCFSEGERGAACRLLHLHRCSRRRRGDGIQRQRTVVCVSILKHRHRLSLTLLFHPFSSSCLYASPPCLSFNQMGGDIRTLFTPTTAKYLPHLNPPPPPTWPAKS